MAALLLSRHITCLIHKEIDWLSKIYQDSGPSLPPCYGLAQTPWVPTAASWLLPCQLEQPSTQLHPGSKPFRHAPMRPRDLPRLATSLPPAPTPLLQHTWPHSCPPGSSTRSIQMPHIPTTLPSPFPVFCNIYSSHMIQSTSLLFISSHWTVQRQTSLFRSSLHPRPWGQCPPCGGCWIKQSLLEGCTLPWTWYTSQLL